MHTQPLSPSSSPTHCPPCSPAVVSPDALRLQLSLLSPHLSSLAVPGKSSFHSRKGLEALLGHGSICHPKAEARGSRAVLLSGPCMAAVGRAESSWQAEGSLALQWHLLVTVQQEDRPLQGMDAGLHSQEPRQGWGPALFTRGETVAAAQKVQLTSSTCIPHWMK